MDDQKSVRCTYTIPKSIIDRLEEYEKATSKWKRFNKSAVVADALDKKLTEKGF